MRTASLGRAAPLALVALASAVMMRWTSPELTVHGVSPGMSRAQLERKLGTTSQESPDAPDWRSYPLAGSSEVVSIRFSRGGPAAVVEGPELEVEGAPVTSREALLRRLGSPDQVQGAPPGPSREFALWLYPKRRLMVVTRHDKPWRFILGCARPSEKR